jgi:hypothetical protein
MEVQELGYLDTSTREAWPGEPIGDPYQNKKNWRTTWNWKGFRTEVQRFCLATPYSNVG